MPEFNTVGYLFDPSMGIDTPISVSTDHSLDESEDGFLRLEELGMAGEVMRTTYYKHVDERTARLERTVMAAQLEYLAAQASWQHLLGDLHLLGVPARMHPIADDGWTVLIVLEHGGWHAFLKPRSGWLPRQRPDIMAGGGWELQLFSGAPGSDHGESGYTIGIGWRPDSEADDHQVAEFVAPLLKRLLADDQAPEDGADAA